MSYRPTSPAGLVRAKVGSSGRFFALYYYLPSATGRSAVKELRDLDHSFGFIADLRDSEETVESFGRSANLLSRTPLV
jgi:hypothetical protein